MTPREIVLRAIEFGSPPRVPINYCNRDFEHSDTIGVGGGAAQDFQPSRPGETEWGYVWESLDHTMGQPTCHPLEDWRHHATYKPPNPLDPGRWSHLDEQLSKWEGRFIKFSVGISGFNQATFLRGFDTFLMDLYTDRDKVEKTLDLVFNFENGLIEKALTFPVDCIAFGDDWGTQRGLMIQPELWREVFKPRYREQFARIRQAGKKVWFHTCGDVRSILGDLIEIGVDVLELLQPDLLGIEHLGRELGGKVCFCCSVDHQRRATHGSRDEIFQYAKSLQDHLGRFNGGFIAYIEDYASLGMSEQNYQWIREAFHGL